jgi:hypothetical protein
LSGKEGFGLHFGGELFGLIDVMNLTACQAERQWIARSIDDHMNFGGQAAAGAVYGWIDWRRRYADAPARSWRRSWRIRYPVVSQRLEKTLPNTAVGLI